MTMKRSFALLTLAILALAACTDQPDPTPRPTIEPTSDDKPEALPTRKLPPEEDPDDNPEDEEFTDPSDLAGPPQIRLVVDGTPEEGYQGSYCWTDPAAGVGLCVDKIPPQFDSATNLPAGEPIQLQLDAPLPDTIVFGMLTEVFGESLASETVQGAESLTWSPAVEPGQYILTVSATWQDSGDVVYMFSINLAE